VFVEASSGSKLGGNGNAPVGSSSGGAGKSVGGIAKLVIASGDEAKPASNGLVTVGGTFAKPSVSTFGGSGPCPKGVLFFFCAAKAPPARRMTPTAAPIATGDVKLASAFGGGGGDGGGNGGGGGGGGRIGGGVGGGGDGAICSISSITGGSIDATSMPMAAERLSGVNDSIAARASVTNVGFAGAIAELTLTPPP